MVTEQGKVYFLEVNPRLQVEHTVSEEVCGLDLVREQLTIANGGELTVDHPLRGHSFELRLTCEDPAKNLAPSSGTLTSSHGRPARASASIPAWWKATPSPRSSIR